MTKLKWLALVLSLNLVACQYNGNTQVGKDPRQDQQNAQSVNADKHRIEAHMRFLASDLLEGRDTGTRGHEIAAGYLASQFSQYGLQPAGDDGTFYQRVPFRRSTLIKSSPSLSMMVNGKQTALTYPKDYLTEPSSTDLQSQLSGELIFVGYGVVAERIGHNDYQGLDVEGKVVVMLSGKPKSFPSELGSHFASTREKTRYAAERGAIGIITITTPAAEKLRPYKKRLAYLDTPSFRWVGKDGVPGGVYPQIRNTAFFSMAATEILFEGASTPLETIYQQLADDEIPKGFPLQAAIDFSKTTEHEEISSPNVVAVLPGSDPTLKEEYVFYTAHADHIGISRSVEKDKINNGAMDNATGTSVLIEMARLFSQLDVRPKRSILFVAVTAEERGLLGSDYFAHYPTVEKHKLAANVNLDMPILTYEFTDIIAFGAEHSEMKASVERATQAMGVKLTPDPVPEMNLFTRSDHYSFVKQGIPALFVVVGWTAVDPRVSGKAQFFEFLNTHYHRPSDEITEKFNWDSAKKFTEVNFKIGHELATQQPRVKWNKDNFFGDTFGNEYTR